MARQYGYLRLRDRENLNLKQYKVRYAKKNFIYQNALHTNILFFVRLYINDNDDMSLILLEMARIYSFPFKCSFSN